MTSNVRLPGTTPGALGVVHDADQDDHGVIASAVAVRPNSATGHLVGRCGGVAGSLGRCVVSAASATPSFANRSDSIREVCILAPRTTCTEVGMGWCLS